MTADTQIIPEDIMATAAELASATIRNYERNGRANVARDAIAKAIDAAVAAERARIVARLLEEADITPCGEDAVVTRSNAFLIKADFSYEEAERLSDIEEA